MGGPHIISSFAQWSTGGRCCSFCHDESDNVFLPTFGRDATLCTMSFSPMRKENDLKGPSRRKMNLLESDCRLHILLELTVALHPAVRRAQFPSTSKTITSTTESRASTRREHAKAAGGSSQRFLMVHDMLGHFFYCVVICAQPL